jgi:hypothetical protein
MGFWKGNMFILMLLSILLRKPARLRCRNLRSIIEMYHYIEIMRVYVLNITSTEARKIG